MNRWRSYWLGLLASAGLASALWAQAPVPVAPAAPVAAVPVAGAPAAAPAAAPAPANLWTFLCPDPAKIAACKAKFCACPLGQLITSMMAPAAAMSGGILGNCCPLNAPNPADLAQPSDTPAGAAAQIKKDELEAKKRREAVRYLGTVDCHYWPEAQLALINALRADRNECVRLEAAWSLGRGCCCTRKTIVALSITVAGSDRDGNPSENCERVRAAAAASLSHCLACLADTAPLSLEPAPVLKDQKKRKEEIRPQGPEQVPAGPAVKPISYYEQVEKLPMKDVAAVARRVLEKVNNQAKANPSTDLAHSGAFNIIANAVAQNNARASATTATAQVVVEEDTSFKTPPFFMRKNAETPPVVVTTPPPPMMTSPGTPTPAPVVSTTYVPLAQPKLAPPIPAGSLPVAPAPAISPPAAPAITSPVITPSAISPPTIWTPASSTPIVPPPAPKPASAPVIQTSYAPNVSKPVAASAPAMPARLSEPTWKASDLPKYVRDLIATVKSGKSCEEGLAAVFSLANSEWRSHPEVVVSLTTAARQHPLLPVRITAIRCLVGIRVNNLSVRNTLQVLKSDADPTVRSEAEQALNSLVFYTPPRDGTVIR